MVVHEVPVKELLFVLARDASINADVHPLTEGLVTLNAIDQTLDEILDRIVRQLDIRYYRRGGVLVIEPDTPVFRNYRIDYVNVARDMRSSSSTATQVAAGGGKGSQASLGNNSSTDIDSLSSNRFWDRITTAVQAIVRGGGERPARAAEGGGAQEARDSRKAQGSQEAREERRAPRARACPRVLSAGGRDSPPGVS